MSETRLHITADDLREGFTDELGRCPFSPAQLAEWADNLDIRFVTKDENKMTHDEIMALDADALRLEVARVLYGAENVQTRWCVTMPDSCGYQEEQEFLEDKGFTPEQIEEDVKHWNGKRILCRLDSGPYIDGSGTWTAWEITPDWPRDIAAAWGLWDELPSPKRIHQDGDTITVMCGGYSYGAATDLACAIRAEGETVQIALCRARLMLGNVK